ncbi:MAG: hypothetical protein CO186_07000 [Zetaproteobacteria bacterium CG_4_9_14_3_um_filter_49_83]|nr:MAG: hypothetical protein AUJ56_04860 [Zetaproteobacteria bacterium CG1_02_49_23]PIQ33937.1 MAG: hypothetical protein COW62_03855 [Zetaproteobacteria bacterium CG17_big_fil_post_rev_8_21_14_2_50_50_13]PIV30178.1 MAG: hypothetical protein COS35_08140 [Zetaproteobacteria bacterium CG02_land_8_20_14_3_00_50_9]PIY54868.1 MAG: hypothetical protein COZ00_12560 [Zetaproteobacteria bacterium CG_4_10_14_0_8_um_filter_49_80]PJA35206.1 MAG: hypothetical protein CO186_07000 [Zetaproteobacteria bacterium
MKNAALSRISGLVTIAHTRIQQDFKYIDPVVSVSHKMREIGIPADAMTIDCMKTGKRILLVVHDEEPNIVSYQFGFRNQDPDKLFRQIALYDVTSEVLYDWISRYF